MIKSIVFVQGNQIAVLPDGTLVDIGAMLFRGSGVQPTPQQYFWTTLVSTNGARPGAPEQGRTAGNGAADQPGHPEPDLARSDGTRRGLPSRRGRRSLYSGALYMVFADGIGTGFNHVKLTKSTDGGKHWTTPVDVTETPLTTHSFNGTVEVTDDGTVAVLYYDFRNNTHPAPVYQPTFGWLIPTMAGKRGPSSTSTARSTWRTHRWPAVVPRDYMGSPRSATT